MIEKVEKDIDSEEGFNAMVLIMIAESFQWNLKQMNNLLKQNIMHSKSPLTCQYK